MNEKKPVLKDELAKLEKVEVETLSDADLASVAGGVTDAGGGAETPNDCNSWWCCSNIAVSDAE